MKQEPNDLAARRLQAAEELFVAQRALARAQQRFDAAMANVEVNAAGVFAKQSSGQGERQ